MELTKEELKVVLECLVFASSTDACINTEKFDSQAALNVAKKLNDPSIELDCFLFKGTGYYDVELSEFIEQNIPQIKIEDE